MIRPVGTQDANRSSPDRAGTAPLAEPPTARALWPTFMRRTLDEDVLRPQDLPARRAP
jgi:hypothetical protein